MASRTPGKDRPSAGRNARPSLTQRVMATLVVSLIAIRARFLRAITIAIGLWLLGYGYEVGGYPAAPGYLNLIVIGILLCALGLIPTDYLQPTHSWREYYAYQRRE